MSDQPNDLWCADYKGEFMLADRRYCYPLTISDFASRYLISCEALSTTRELYAFSVFERVFKDFGLPKAIRTDNGVPFASAHALFGLSKLAVWWLRLGIGIERIKPGHPQQNGRHERMHLTLKKEATKPAAPNFLQQQARFDDFIEVFNHQRPSVFLRDIGTVEDSSDIVTGYAEVNGRRTVYIPVTKRADASTLNVVNEVKSNLAQFQSVVPPDIKIDYVFDQSSYVRNSLLSV